MARIPRRLLVDVGSTHHCVFRSHNGMSLFGEPAVAEYFLELLGHYKEKYGIRVHSYCLMSTHPHVVLTATQGQQAFSSFWQCVNHALAVFFNRRAGRRGQVVMERLKSPAIATNGQHMLTVMRYGDLNPVRAGLAQSPKDWQYSSYRYYAFGEENPLIDAAPDYLALGDTPEARRRAYQGLFALPLSEQLRVKREELNRGPFIGPLEWVQAQLRRAGLWPAGPPGFS